MRVLLEPAGLEQLEREQDEHVLDRLAHFFDDYSHPMPTEGYLEYFARDRAFHNLIVSCSRNGRIMKTYAVMQNHIDRGRNFLMTTAPGRADETLDEHQAVATALGKRDFDLTRAELIRHLKTGEQLMIEAVRVRRRT